MGKGSRETECYLGKHGEEKILEEWVAKGEVRGGKENFKEVGEGTHGRGSSNFD